jgi:hypothetical protein
MATISVRKILLFSSVPFLSNRQIEKHLESKKSTITACTGLILMGVGFAVSDALFLLQIEISRLYKTHEVVSERRH